MMNNNNNIKSVEGTTNKSTAAAAGTSNNLEEVNDTVSRISSHNGVSGVMILSEIGEIITSTFPRDKQTEQANIICKVKKYSSSLFEDDEISFIRIRSTQGNELLIAPNNSYLLVVLHDPLVSSIDQQI
mmetsp:Transcript_13341/g.15294  ORF Transcript_13341/g.15294 Transcript_13341/m.15294 type:complete len:129 (-) Transcript_13341:89-475(-)|eukprot:CAMPEP_0194131134 /NCGR_PEP_ID=MMETSP0152-20130528/1963_1 /TAXON_ID=1049557 /ORGANISM="Thalassiothrix antarctica, Strain L6-D1" /LENGTH=128 /DNA_ID=CAMNT_0038825813 /DNA_START=21 /DNA_END=407 /DNA_ORIENTATION=+